MISFVEGYFGWLGNRMFQYAATYALSRHRETACGFPWGYPEKADLFRIFNLSVKRLSVLPKTSLYQEPHFHYDADFWNQPDGTQLAGYFQSERYFAPYADALRKEFSLVYGADVNRQPKTASIHVRRGDYLSFPDHHPPCTLDYYREAMARFPGWRFLVFSDDPGWCLANLKAPNVDIIVGQTPQHDLELMSLCEGHIIANSSFSWWGAWLDPNPDKKVIAPAAWFGPAKAGWDTRDLYCARWEVI